MSLTLTPKLIAGEREPALHKPSLIQDVEWVSCTETAEVGNGSRERGPPRWKASCPAQLNGISGIDPSGKHTAS